MKMEDEHIQNVFALNVKDEEVFIENVERGRKGYFCMGCKMQMQAVKPKTKNIRAYFRHDVIFTSGIRKCTYSDETYRHKLAKEILQIEKKIKVPALYKYPPKGIFGMPNQIFESRYIEAFSVAIELYFYEDENGEISWGKSDEAKEKFLLVKPDVTFFDKNNKPILFIELAATHKVDDDKRNRFKRLGIDTVEVSIPKDSPEAIAKTFKKTERTKWIYNYEHERSQYIFIPNSFGERVQPIDELQRKLFEESPKCRSAQIRNLIFTIERYLESEQYKRIERNLRSEISRVERNTRVNKDEWGGICKIRSEEVTNQFRKEEEEYRKSKETIDREEFEFQDYIGGLETRYIRKKEELERITKELQSEEINFDEARGKIDESIRREEETIGTIIEQREKVDTEVGNFGNNREQLTERFKELRRRAIESFKFTKRKEKEETGRAFEDFKRTSENFKMEEGELSKQHEEEERTVIGATTNRYGQFLRNIKDGKFEDFEFERKITNRVNEFNESMALLENISTIYKHRERIRNALNTIRSGAYKNWKNQKELF